MAADQPEKSALQLCEEMAEAWRLGFMLQTGKDLEAQGTALAKQIKKLRHQAEEEAAEKRCEPPPPRAQRGGGPVAPGKGGAASADGSSKEEESRREEVPAPPGQPTGQAREKGEKNEGKRVGGMGPESTLKKLLFCTPVT